MENTTMTTLESANLDMDIFPRLLERRQAERDRIAADFMDRQLLADIAVAGYRRRRRQAVKQWLTDALSFCAALGGLAGIGLLMTLTWR